MKRFPFRQRQQKKKSSKLHSCSSFFHGEIPLYCLLAKENQKGEFSMYEDFNTFLLKLPEDCKNFIAEDCLVFHLPRKHHNCPACGSSYIYVDRYRKQELIGIPDTSMTYIYNNRRYRCRECGKTFSEERSFIDAYQRMPRSVIDSIVREHGDLVSTAHIAHRHDISSLTVMRHFARAHQNEETSPLDTAVGLDEFSGHVGAKYQVVINALRTRRCCNVIDDRSAATIYDRILSYPLSERENVSIVSIDLSPFFHKIVEECFPNARIAADKFHAVRLAVDALDIIRREVQANLPAGERKHFRNARRILLGRETKLRAWEKNKLIQMFSMSERLKTAHALKEEYCRLFDSTDRKDFAARLHLFRQHVHDAGLAPFARVLKTTEQWKEEIWTGIETGYNNGFTEGCNNTIKVLKRVCYGFRNFENFRRRILFILNNEERIARRTKKA